MQWFSFKREQPILRGAGGKGYERHGVRANGPSPRLPEMEIRIRFLAMQAIAVAANGDNVPRMSGIRLHVPAQAHDEAVNNPGLRIGA